VGCATIWRWKCGVLRFAGANDVRSCHRPLRTFWITAISDRSCPVVWDHVDDNWTIPCSKARIRSLNQLVSVRVVT
jgi:hypothetical protein